MNNETKMPDEKTYVQDWSNPVVIDMSGEPKEGEHGPLYKALINDLRQVRETLEYWHHAYIDNTGATEQAIATLNRIIGDKP